MTHIILHSGQHKTGSSSIQLFLHANREALDQRGLFVPVSGMSRHGSHRPLLGSLTGEGPAILQQRLARELSREQPIRAVLSAEFAKKAIVSGQGEQIINGLREVGAATVEILLYLRAPFALANSAYSQRTGNLMGRGNTFREHIAEMFQESYFDYHQFLDLANRTDVRLNVRPYSGAARQSVVGDFLNALGVPEEGLTEEPRLNVAFGPVALEAMRVIRGEIGGIARRERIQLRNRLHRIAQNLREDPFWGIDAEIERLLEPADKNTNDFSLAVWKKPWRELLGDEQRPLNIFDLTDVAKATKYQRVLARMRDVSAKTLKEAGVVPTIVSASND